jgi:hypothetical protein
MGGLVLPQAQNLSLGSQAHFGRVKAQVLLQNARLNQARSGFNYALAKTCRIGKVKFDLNFLVHARAASVF